MDNEQDRRDLLTGREKRLRKAWQDKRNAQEYRLHWVDEATDGKDKTFPVLTVAQYDAEVGDSLRLANAEMQIALREWLVCREELAALDKPAQKGKNPAWIAR